jgi:hypothetical protein
MNIGSFLSSAGRIGEGIEKYQTESELRRLQQQQAALARAELTRQDEFRRLQLGAPTAEVPKQGLLTNKLPVAEPEFTPAGAPAFVAGLSGAPAAAVTAAGVPAVAGLAAAPAAPTAAAPAAPKRVTLGGVVIPGFSSADPITYNTSGMPGFRKLDPNVSDINRNIIEGRNKTRLNTELKILGAQIKEPWTSVRKPFASQDEKRRLEEADRTSQWYQSPQAFEYFSRNPEMLPVARANPIEFRKKMFEASRLRAQPRGAVPTATVAAPAQGGLVSTKAVIAGAETGGVASAGGDPYQTPNLAGASTAYGKYQFTRPTWIGTYRKLNPRTNLSDDRIWAQRTNPELQERLMDKLTQENSASLKSAGLPVNDATLYLAHFLGSSGANKLLRADANTPVERILGKKAINANPTVLSGRTVGQVAQWAVGKVGGAAPAGGGAASAGGGAASAGGAQVASVQNTPVPVRIDPSNFYLANPDATSQDTRMALQNRQELARMADMYRRAGMGNEFTAARLKLIELDNSLIYLQGMQGLQELTLANDPRRLAAVWSDYAGVPVQLQPQTDGTFNVLVNGRVTQRGVARSSVIDAARSSFDKQYVQAQSAAAADQASEYFKSQLRMTEKAAEAVAKFTADIQLKLLEGKNTEALEVVKQLDPNGKVTMLPGDSGQAILQVQGQTLLIDKGGVQIEGAPEGMISGPSARPIAGLPQRTVGVGTGG